MHKTHSITTHRLLKECSVFSVLGLYIDLLEQRLERKLRAVDLSHLQEFQYTVSLSAHIVALKSFKYKMRLVIGSQW